jgi:hypothetical protein
MEVPRLIVETEDEKRRFREGEIRAQRRRDLRKKQKNV